MCQNKDCGIHFRNDVETVEDVDGMNFLTKVTYHGEWAIFTDDNTFLPYLIMLGKKMLPHMTLLVKVGEGKSLSDVIEGGATGLKDAVYDGYFTEDFDKAKEAHDMVLYGVQSGILSPTKPVTPYDIVMNY